MTNIVLAVHGGAGRLAKRKTRYPGRRLYEAAIAKALRVGQKILLNGGSSLNAVMEAVVVLEDDPLLNAGKGAALCADGTVEVCASIMRGLNCASGAMVGLKRTKNPIRGAHALVRYTHDTLFGRHADKFAEDMGLQMVDESYFITEERYEQWIKYKNKKRMVLDHSDIDSPHGTVGAVAMDRRGNLAAATSTGGLVNQQPGRIGDSPIIGAGTWADNRTCAISATGTGEAFSRLAFARRVADLIELAGMPAEYASQQALNEVSHMRGQGGCIIIDSEGNLSMPFNSPQMIRGFVNGHAKPKFAMSPDEENEVGLY